MPYCCCYRPTGCARRNQASAARRHRLARGDLTHPPFQNRRQLAVAVDGPGWRGAAQLPAPGRPKTDVQEIFIRTRAPYRPLSDIYSEVRRRLEAAGVKLPENVALISSGMPVPSASCAHPCPGKLSATCWAIVRTEATIPYLKLATEDLRAIALEIPDRRCAHEKLARHRWQCHRPLSAAAPAASPISSKLLIVSILRGFQDVVSAMRVLTIAVSKPKCS